MGSSPKIWKPFNSLPFHLLKTGSSVIRQNWWKVIFCWQASYISKFLFIIVTRLSRSFLRIVKRYSIHRLQFGFINTFIVPIRFICFTTLNVIFLRRSVRSIVELKYCSKWAANESDFCLLLSRSRSSEKWPSKIFHIIYII